MGRPGRCDEHAGGQVVTARIVDDRFVTALEQLALRHGLSQCVRDDVAIALGRIPPRGTDTSEDALARCIVELDDERRRLAESLITGACEAVMHYAQNSYARNNTAPPPLRDVLVTIRDLCTALGVPPR